MTKKVSRPITGKTVLYGMLAFFGVIFAVNGTFVYFALSSWPELVSDKAYVEGLNYNATLIEAKAQKDLGWTSHLEFVDGALSVTFKDKHNAPLTGLTIKSVIKRPVEDITPIILALPESPQNQGIYYNAVKFPLPGRWSVMIEASHSDRTTYRMEYEIFIE